MLKTLSRERVSRERVSLPVTLSRERGRDSLSRESDSLSRESLGPFETLGPDGHWAPFKLSRESLNKVKLGKDHIGRTRIGFTDPPET